MNRPIRTVCNSLIILAVFGSVLVVGLWRLPESPRSTAAPETVAVASIQAPAPAIQPVNAPVKPPVPTKWKLVYPRFFVTVDDLTGWFHEPNVPLFKGSVQFLGEWPPKGKKDGEADAVPIAAHYGVDWDGFYTGYELTAEVPPAIYGRTRLSMADLKKVNIRYTDDLLEANARRNITVGELIKLLRRPENQVRNDYSTIVPGGEMLQFSAPLKALMFRGAEARAPLLAQVDDAAIRNEVVLALGAVGDENTVAELIARYPSGRVDEKDRAAVLTRVCFSYALSWLTGQEIDRSRRGTDLEPHDAEKWKDWWTANRDTFHVSTEKPGGTWVPSYPALAADHIANIRKRFAERGDGGLMEYE